MNATITWDENPKTGRGELTMQFANGIYCTLEHDEPIGAGTDAGAIVALFANLHFDWAERDGRNIRAGSFERCGDCHAPMPHPVPDVPDADDDAAWEAERARHAADCDWVATRAGLREHDGRHAV